MNDTSRAFKSYFFVIVFICSCTAVEAGLNKFTNLIVFEEWLIERKVDLATNEVECRASIPTHANWFGARVRLGTKNELIKPKWISVKKDQLLESKLDKVKKLLVDCRSGFLYIPDNF